MKTVKQRITDYRTEILNQEIQPNRAAQILNELSALYGNALEEVKERQMNFNKQLALVMDVEKTTSKARITAETSNEYQLLLEAKNTEKLIIEMIRSMKYYLRVKEDEFRETN